MTAREKQTVAFLRAKLEENPVFHEHPMAKDYRLEHSFRVAHIGREIARKEGFNEEHMTLACLLHDVSYCRRFESKEDWISHGREAAAIARPFLLELGLEKPVVEEICYGIAIHVDDRSDFDGERTAFALTVGDADNIDRFDTYRLYETLETANYSQLPLAEKTAYVNQTMGRLQQNLKLPFATETGTALWRDRIGYYLSFYQRLADQLAASVEPGCSLLEKTEAPENATNDWMMGVSGRF